MSQETTIKDYPDIDSLQRGFNRREFSEIKAWMKREPKPAAELLTYAASRLAVEDGRSATVRQVTGRVHSQNVEMVRQIGNKVKTLANAQKRTQRLLEGMQPPTVDVKAEAME